MLRAATLLGCPDPAGIVVPGKRKLEMSAVATMEALRHGGAGCSEAGGILLGSYFEDVQGIVVYDVTVPGPGDHAERYAFHRECPSHQEAINRAWDESNGRRNYVGEWHTHDEDHPNPSPIDLASWNERVAEVADQGWSAPLMFVIVGRVSTKVWELWP